MGSFGVVAAVSAAVPSLFALVTAERISCGEGGGTEVSESAFDEGVEVAELGREASEPKAGDEVGKNAATLGLTSSCKIVSVCGG